MTSTKSTESKPVKVKSYTYKPTDDSYKFACWCLRRGIASVTGAKFGDTKFDENVGTAVASVYPAEVWCKTDEMLKIVIHAAAGAWKGVK